eukprot:151214_1
MADPLLIKMDNLVDFINSVLLNNTNEKKEKKSIDDTASTTTQTHTIDTQIFKKKKNKCNGISNCSYIKRIMTALSYYNKVSINEHQDFIEFFDKNYSFLFLEDYIHFMCVHKNNTKAMQYKTCSSVNNCTATTRHYRNRERDDIKNENSDVSKNMYIDLFDNMHFYVNHIEEIGLRITINNNDKYENSYSQLRDKTIATIQKEIEMAKKKCGLFDRLDNTKNSKFNIMDINYNHTSLNKTDNDEKEERNNTLHSIGHKHKQTKNSKAKTFVEHMAEHISVDFEEKTMDKLNEYLLSEEYDTDCIENDVNIYDSDKTCNLLSVLDNNINYIQTIKRFIQYCMISVEDAFSTGFVFWYWKHWKNVNENTIKQRRHELLGENTDFGGYSIRELFVEKYFGSLKQEVLESRFISLKQFNEKIIRKGDAYYRTNKCRQ